MEAYQTKDVEELEKELGADWKSIRKAREYTPKVRMCLEEGLRKVLLFRQWDIPFDDISIVVFGSLARKEFTSGSDIDWTLLVDGRANPEHLDIALKFEEELRTIEIEGRKIKGPARDGTFGGLAFSHDIIHNIGGIDDTNKNTTQRILLLLESVSIGHQCGENKAHERVIQGVLNRYISEDRVSTAGETKVPRFLLNDIVRYWRTMAVDFGHKRRQRQGKGSALRVIKLRLSRKLIYVSGMVACFACEMDEFLPQKKYSKNISNYLYHLLQQSPLDILSSIVLSYEKQGHDQLYSSAKILMDNYDKFLQLLDDQGKREHLDNLLPYDADSDKLYQESKKICECFQEGLNGIFLAENGTKLFSLVKKYGVF